MGQRHSEKRPWLAALLAVLATGLGHLYLRRWRRAVGWLLLLFGVNALFVDPSALNALTTGGPVDPVALAPTLVVGAVSVADAYFLARVQNVLVRRMNNPEDHTPTCPNCGKELDTDLDFCPWCTREFEGELQ